MDNATFRKEFIDRLCKYLNSKLGVDFTSTTYKYFGSKGLFNHTYNHKGSFYDKNILPSSLNDFVINGNNIIFNITDQDYSNIIWYFDWSKNKKIKKHILDFYFQNNILFCPYCGLNQFQMILNDDLSSFDLDHFLPKRTFPQFALSLYNLFPVCKYCNQTLKGKNNPLKNGQTAFHSIWGWLTSSKNGDTYTFTKINEKTFDEVIDCKGIEVDGNEKCLRGK